MDDIKHTQSDSAAHQYGRDNIPPTLHTSPLQAASFPLPTDDDRPRYAVEEPSRADPQNGLGNFRFLANMTAVGAILLFFGFKLYSDERNRDADREERKRGIEHANKAVEGIREDSHKLWLEMRDVANQTRVMNGNPPKALVAMESDE